MGHATAEAVVSAGFQLVPWSFTGESEAVVVGNIGVSGIPVQLIGKQERQEAMQRVKDEYPGLVMIDFTLPGAVNGQQMPPTEVLQLETSQPSLESLTDKLVCTKRTDLGLHFSQSISPALGLTVNLEQPETLFLICTPRSMSLLLQRMQSSTVKMGYPL